MKKAYLSLSRTGIFRLPHASMKYQPAGKTEIGRQLKRLLYSSIESGRPQSQVLESVMMVVILVCVIYFYIPFVVPRVFACFLSSFLLLLCYVFLSPSHILILSTLFYSCLPFIFNCFQFFRCENVPYCLLQISLVLSL